MSTASKTADFVTKSTLTYRLAWLGRSESWMKFSTDHPFMAWWFVRLPLAVLALVLFPLTIVGAIILAVIDSAYELGWRRAIVGYSKDEFAALGK